MRFPPSTGESKKTILLIFAIASLSCLAFEPSNTPPQKTIAWTSAQISQIILPQIEFDKNTSVEEAIDFLQMKHLKPTAYCVEIDVSALSEKQKKSTVAIKEKNITILSALSKIADHLDARLLIKPGKICIVP